MFWKTSITAYLILLSAIDGFVVPQTGVRSAAASISLSAKGFGDDSKKATSAASTSEPLPEKTVGDDVLQPSTPNPFQVVRDETDLSMGKAALEKIRRQRAEQRNAELQKMKDVKDVDAMLRESPGAAAIPEKVAQRMGKRMLPFVGIPLFGGMGVFVGFWYMATYRDTEFEPAMVAASTIVILVVGLLGITYSVMSASWDDDREGSFLGADEFTANLENIKTGLSRSRETARLRDQMMDVPDSVLENLNKKDDSKEKKKVSFQDKMGDELD